MALRAFLLKYSDRQPRRGAAKCDGMRTLHISRSARWAASAAGVCLIFTCANVVAAQAGRQASLAVEFTAAEAAYNAGQFPQAQSRLETLHQKSPKSFQINELLGLTYSAEGNHAEAVTHLRTAASLAPASAVAKLNLGTALVRAAKIEDAKAVFKQALAQQPRDFDANRSLAALLLAQGLLADAKPYLRTAHDVRPDDYGTSYNLALAMLMTGDRKEARVLTEALMAKGETGELHNLLGRIDEQDGQFLPAANEFAAAARLEPSEENLFVWGSEMLLHRTYVAAITIFRDATRRYPNAPRLWVGLGMALYSRGEYVDAVHFLLKAAELDPTDPRCYLFLSKAYLSAPDQAHAVIECFRKYAALEPANARAQFYYAMSLWKGRRVESAEIDYPAVEALLTKSIQLDSSIAEPHLQLGILYNDEHAYAKALPEYERALQLDPKLAEAHFRLGRYYLRSGEKDRAQAELDRFKTLQAEHQAEVDKERAEVQQFVVAAEAAPTAAHQ